jgi:predicted dehydrogenase
MKAITLQELGVAAEIPLPVRRDWRIGLVGFGGIAIWSHVPAYQKAGWNIVAVADPSEGAQEKAREMLPEARIYSDYTQLLQETEVDAVALLTQPVLRLPVVQVAAKFGRPVLIEKPLANTLEEAQQIVQLGEEHSLPIAVSQNYRWDGANFFARQLVEQGYVGEMHFASIEIFGTQDRDLAGHSFYSQCDDFMTVQWNTHLADLLQFWSGAVPQRRWTVTRRSSGQNFKSNGLLFSVIELGDNLTGHILHSELVRSGATGAMCRIDGSEGSLVFPMSGDYVEIYSSRLDNEPARLDLSTLNLAHSMAGSMGDLLLSIEQKREPSVSARRNLATLNAVFSDQKSSEQGGAWL